MGDYFYQTEFSYPMLESPSTTSEISANMASQEYSGLENADLYFPIESSWSYCSFPEPDLEPYPEQYLPLENSPPEDTASRAGSTRPKSFVCEICQMGFTRPVDLKRHHASTHTTTVFEDCPMDNCTRKGRNGFTRKDHLVEHVRQFHRVPIKKRKSSKINWG